MEAAELPSGIHRPMRRPRRMGPVPAAAVAVAVCAALSLPALGARPGLRAGADQRFLHAGTRAGAAAAVSEARAPRTPLAARNVP